MYREVSRNIVALNVASPKDDHVFGTLLLFFTYTKIFSDGPEMLVVV